MKILNADDKWFEQDSGTQDPVFSIPILSSLHYTGQNHRMKIQFESMFLVISKIQRKPQLSITYSGTNCNVLCHPFLPFLCIIWTIDYVSRCSIQTQIACAHLGEVSGWESALCWNAIICRECSKSTFIQQLFLELAPYMWHCIRYEEKGNPDSFSCLTWEVSWACGYVIRFALQKVNHVCI